MTYHDFLVRLDTYLWLMNLVTILLVAWHDNKVGRISSTLVTLLAIAVFDGSMTAYTPDLLGFIRSYEPSASGGGEPLLYQLGLATWYIGFTIIGLMTLVVIWKVHVWYHIRYSSITRLHLVAIVALAVMQFVRYMERLIFETHYLRSFYQSGVLSINVCVTVVTSLMVLFALYAIFGSNKMGREHLWSL